MKRLIACCIMIFLALTCVPCAAAALAVDLPYVVIGKDIWLLADDNTRLFLLPETYYARVINLDDSYYYITFNGVNGKVERNSVSPIGYHTEAGGTLREIRVDRKYSAFTEIKLKSRMEGTNEDIPVPVDGSFVFLGKYPTSQEVWYYIRYNEVCGYIRADFTTDPEMEIAPFVPEERPQTPTEEEPTTEEPQTDNKIVKILIITGLAVAVIILLILIFRPRKKKVNRYYYEDEG